MSHANGLDALVIGAGVVGLAVGRALAAAGMDTVIVERHRRIGEETSSRNSCVVHSGLYYPTGSLKARLCVQGRELLYEHCRERGLAHRQWGKLIVAQANQVAALQALHRQGVANGVTDLRWLNPAESRDLEPAVRCAAALYSPSTGVVDVHALMTSLLGDTEARGGTLVLDSSVATARAASDGFEVTIRSGAEAQVVFTRRLVNAAGLGASDVARLIEGCPQDTIPATYLAKGNYFSCSGRPFRHLVYPMPSDAGLGTHATLDLDGSVRFGPDVEWVDTIDYTVDPRRATRFEASIREYWPGLPEGALTPAYAGIRPKLVGPGQKAVDFAIHGPAQHGVPGLVNLIGIESPGLTAALAIGEHVRSILEA